MSSFKKKKILYTNYISKDTISGATITGGQKILGELGSVKDRSKASTLVV